MYTNPAAVAGVDICLFSLFFASRMVEEEHLLQKRAVFLCNSFSLFLFDLTSGATSLCTCISGAEAWVAFTERTMVSLKLIQREKYDISYINSSKIPKVMSPTTTNNILPFQFNISPLAYTKRQFVSLSVAVFVRRSRYFQQTQRFFNNGDKFICKSTWSFFFLQLCLLWRYADTQPKDESKIENKIFIIGKILKCRLYHLGRRTNLSKFVLWYKQFIFVEEEIVCASDT